MAAFQYISINIKGVTKKGIIEADSPKEARRLLRAQGLTPLEIALAQKKITLLKTKNFGKPAINAKELALMTRQLATLLAAGLPLEEVLIAVAEQTEKTRTKGLILSVRSKVLEGHALASAMRDYPEAFSTLYCSTVSAGEKSGHLDIVLQRLADYTEQQLHMRQKIQQALIYPSVMICVALGILGFLLEYVVPKMITVYSNIGQTLPTLTRILIAISTHLKSIGLYIFLLVILAVFLFRYLMKRKSHFRNQVHLFLLHIPVIGNAIKVINTARFSRTFAILSSAGVPILEAMHISSKLITNLPIYNAVEDATKRVQEGANMSSALKQTKYFPPMSIHLIASGETSGQLENMLERAANNQDNEITRLIETVLTLFEPAIVILMGAIVLFIVLAILLPIFQLDQLTG
ncbi:MAG: epsF 1 [Gammaproteobacteria bacterium]|jgi:general secretion pathway protein F|nr:epsF 1 [Gammaproteobacteria bacterium]